MNEQIVEDETIIIIIRYKIGTPVWYRVSEQIVLRLYTYIKSPWQ